MLPEFTRNVKCVWKKIKMAEKNVACWTLISPVEKKTVYDFIESSEHQSRYDIKKKYMTRQI